MGDNRNLPMMSESEEKTPQSEAVHLYKGLTLSDMTGIRLTNNDMVILNRVKSQGKYNNSELEDLLAWMIDDSDCLQNIPPPRVSNELQAIVEVANNLRQHLYDYMFTQPFEDPQAAILAVGDLIRVAEIVIIRIRHNNAGRC